MKDKETMKAVRKATLKTVSFILQLLRIVLTMHGSAYTWLDQTTEPEMSIFMEETDVEAEDTVR